MSKCPKCKSTNTATIQNFTGCGDCNFRVMTSDWENMAPKPVKKKTSKKKTSDK